VGPCERILQVYKKGTDHSTSRIQRGDEIREKDSLPELYPLFKEE
jgi:hypothetical protein